MPKVTINAVEYDAYAAVDYADEYLAADVARAETWADATPDNKGRALVTATRLLQRLRWKAGAPAVDTATDPVKQATCLLAADVLAKPALGDSGSSASNVKAVGAGSARVEFFRPQDGQVLPAAAFDLLRGLLGDADELVGVGDAVAFGSCDGQRTRFDDFGLVGGDGDRAYERDERLRW